MAIILLHVYHQFHFHYLHIIKCTVHSDMVCAANQDECGAHEPRE